MKEKLNYEKAFGELTKIVEEIEEGTIKLDMLKEKIDRATELITFCRGRLRATEEEFNKALGKLEVKE
jgi:exodeoxyribonuclease VII small subunit